MGESLLLLFCSATLVFVAFLAFVLSCFRAGALVIATAHTGLIAVVVIIAQFGRGAVLRLLGLLGFVLVGEGACLCYNQDDDTKQQRLAAHKIPPQTKTSDKGSRMQ